MKLLTLICRLLLGLAFTVFGLNGFLHFIPMQPMPAPAANWMRAMPAGVPGRRSSPRSWRAGCCCCPALFVPLALVVIAPVIVNILLFHATMAPSGARCPGVIAAGPVGGGGGGRVAGAGPAAAAEAAAGLTLAMSAASATPVAMPVASTDPVRPTAFRLAELRAGVKPFRLHWYPRLRSTSSHAAVLRRRGALFAPAAVVLTGHQLAGRGRGGNTWWSGRGQPYRHVRPGGGRVAGGPPRAAAGGAGRAGGGGGVEPAVDDVQLKWPNDLLHRGRKLAGLLCERVDKADLVGVGLNVSCDPSEMPADLRERVTSLNAVAGRPVDLTDAVVAVARHLHGTLAHRDQGTFAAALREYDRHHALLGRRVTVSGGPGEPAVTGRCEGLDGTGRLLLRDRRTLHRVIAGQVKVV